MKIDQEETVNFTNMTNSQKAALLLIALGKKWATAIMRQLKPQEIKRVSFWINQVNHVPQEVTEKVIREFYERLAKKTSLSSTGGQDFLVDVLSGIMGKNKAQDVIDELASTEESEVFRILRKVEPKLLAAYLKNEQPQTLALLMSYLEPERSATIILNLPQEIQTDVIFRLARLEDADPDIISAMERSLTSSLGTMASGRRMKKVGGPKAVAEILNHFNHDSEKAIMEAITEADFELAAEVKDLMFVFADVVLLDDKSIQTVIKEVEQTDLILALKGSPDNVKDQIFKNISKRQAESIADELAFMGPVKASSVKESQQKIVNIIRKLDEEGKVLIQGKGAGDEVIS